ncbi:bifunctional riboflavin kinase/FAD synthetase [Ornithinicoccus hortensis]|uniref:Riboflavin biosynthesis protein n=1 Tax=Ornithinicoccus hortensis TaxID=82346 RepID=A0A542YRT7_9MICO|nr:bifunctional riboflavin kinase/FAD synthetase [Ornithinicoccus hortensis]TQL50816.1 riboflavin kinase/FMN adenylyltransferase [Ornithinicoccus hortensis]
MHRWNALEDIPADFGPSVVTLGNFDGVHRGHRAVLSRVVDLAAARDARAVAVTFEPHPVAVLHPERAPERITGAEHRLDLLAESGLDATLVLEFTREFALLTPEEFVRQVFVEALRAVVVVVGVDTRFGVHNSGDVDTMRDLGRELGFEVVTLEPVGGPGQGATRAWSSTRLRQVLAEGDVRAAADILGRHHRVSGMVVHGHHRGRELGYPTANLATDSEGLVPADGVYAGWVERLGLPPGDPDRRMPAAISVGTNPTFDDVLVRTVEAYVLDRTDLDLYDEVVAVDFVAHLRGNLKFDSVQELLEQMARDVAVSRSMLQQ